MAQNFFDQFDAQPGVPGVQVKPADPKAQYEGPAAATSIAKTQQDMRFAAEEADRKRREWNATHFPDGTPKPEAAKPASADPDRIPQIRTVLENIKRIRELSQKSLAVGGYSESAKGLPLVGGWLGQNRANIEGALKMVEGDLIQQQIARLSQMNGGNGVASIANSETEAQRMASSIANLDPNQNLEEFTRGLDRAEQFYRRQFAQLKGANLEDPKERQRYGIALDGTSPRSAPALDMGLATGDQKFVPSEAGSKLATELARAGMSDEQINAALTAANLSTLTPESMGQVRKFLKDNPNYKGVIPGAGAYEQTNLLNKIAASETGTFLGNMGIAGSAGLPVYFGGQDAKQAFDLANEQNPKAALAGGTVGGVTAAVGAGKLLAPFKFAAAAPRAAALGGDLLYGSTYGASTADEDSRGTGALLGASGAALGNVLGSHVISPLSSAFARSRPGQAISQGGNAVLNAGRSVLGRPAVPFTPAPEKLSSATSSLLEAVGDPNNVMPDLQDAQRLGLPFTIADTNAATRSLAGAAARRSPNVKGLAEQALLPRGRGQFDRLQSALDRDTVPGLNIPQQSEDLIKQARTASGPLYRSAYAQPGASSVPLDDLQTRPGFASALTEARKLAAEEGRDPTSLGFDLDAQGNVVLTRVPSFETLDYTKRGMDEVIYGGPKDAFGRPVKTEYTRALDGTRGELVKRIDAVNTDYAAARAAYAGPAKEREAFQLGTQAVNQTPDNIGFTLKGLSPQQQAQYRLGHRSQLDNQLGNIRYSQNPWENALGSPNAQERMSVLYPKGAPNLLTQYGLEGRMAQTQREILGNSMTAERAQADQAFGVSPGAALAIDAASAATTGAPPLLTGLRLGAQYGKDAMKVGFGKKKAEELGPMLFAPIDTASALLADLEAKRLAYEAARATSKRRGGMFGRGVGAQSGVMISN